MADITARIADFAATLSYDDLPAEVATRAKTLIADLVGIALRARNEAPATPSLLAAVDRLGLGGGDATVIGDVAGYAPPAAALLNGALGHALDFDDTHARGSIHSSAPIVPAALTAAEMAGANGRDVIAGIVAGYEVQIRLSLALVPKEQYLRGYHPTAICGAFGAAAAAGRVFGLSAAEIANAFGISLSQAAGSVQFKFNGAWSKAFQVGNAAMSGLIAASLAREGFVGAAEPIEGKCGFLHGYAPAADYDTAVAGLGEVWETLAIAVKPYPSCRYSHAALDALIELRAENDIQADEVEAVEVGLPRTGWDIVGDPEERKHHPQSIVDGQFSMPFLAAVALRQGGVGWDDYTRHLGDEQTLALCQRVHSVVDDRAEAEFPRQMSGVATVRTGRGDFERLVVVPKGEPEAFPSEAEMRAKFAGLAAPYLAPARVEAALDALAALDEADDIGAVLRLTRGADEAPLKAAAGDD
jgi:2-methylcitrate dehydratase PrpD